MNELTIDPKTGKYPFYLIENGFLDLLTNIESKGYFNLDSESSEICFGQLNEIAQSILEGLGESVGDIITNTIGKFRVSNIKLNGMLISSQTLFWSTYAYLYYRFDPSKKGMKKLKKALEKHLEQEIILDLLEPYRLY